MTEIIPAIDIMDGRCVRLTQGDYGCGKVYDHSPSDMAELYAGCGVRRLHLVDLDGAKDGKPRNLRTLEKVAAKTGLELEWGGGISDGNALKSIFDAGATSGIIGSVAVKNPGLMKEWLRDFGPTRIILGADVRDGAVAIKGWTEDSSVTIGELISSFIPDGLAEAICTDITKDGMLQGPSFGFYAGLMEAFPGIRFTASGGISSMEDIRRLSDAGVPKVIVGKAIYEKRISLKEIGKWSQNA